MARAFFCKYTVAPHAVPHPAKVKLRTDVEGILRRVAVKLRRFEYRRVSARICARTRDFDKWRQAPLQ